MKRSVRKILTQIEVAALIYTGVMPGNIFNCSGIKVTERERAAQIQRAELQKYRCYEWELVKSKIKYHEEEIKVLQRSRREKLDSELAHLLQIEEDLKAKTSSYSWWSWECWDLNNQLSGIRGKISSVKSKIDNNNSRINYLKKVIEDLDNEYAIILQNQEMGRMY